MRVCYGVWPPEIAKWKDFNHLSYQILHGKKKQHAYDEEADIYLVNPEGLEWLFSQKDFKKKFRNAMLVVDESSKFKSTNSKRFKLLKQKLDVFNRRVILTGSFAPNGLMDIFGQVYILDGGAALGRYITHYRNKYFYPSGFGGYTWKLQEGAEAEIQKAIKPLTFVLNAEEHLELPKLIPNIIYVDLPPDARKMYDEMEVELFTRISEGDITAVNAAVASGKCCQIANGGIYDEEGNAHFIHNAKTEVVAELLEELNGNPALIAYEYGHDLTRLRALLGKDTPYVGSGVSAKKGEAIKDAWNAGELPYLLGQPASMAHGLNMQDSGNHLIWHSLIWNYEYYDQFIRRVRRSGSPHSKVFNHIIVARDTIDEAKIIALNNKSQTQKQLLLGLNTYLSQKYKKGFTGDKKCSKQVSSLTENEEPKMSKFQKGAAKKAASEKSAEEVTHKTTTDGEVVTLEKGEKVKTAAKKKASTGKAPKAAKAGKVTKAKKSTGTQKAKEVDTRKIKVLVKENPKREGTAAYSSFELYSKAKTVQDFLDAGGKLRTIAHDTEKGFIEVK